MTTALHDRTDVTSVMLRNTGLDDARLESIVSSLRDSTGLQYLNLNCNEITDDGVQHVISLIQDHPQLESLAYVDKKLSYRRGTARRAMLINSCYVSQAREL